ncbi:MAG: hypothetical protein KatS3mg023_3739 [Armatimonadota bacterium]|nr:MAG: hypothetical protein KatS3mg023_3739 [Armatimonadota bacterium]
MQVPHLPGYYPRDVWTSVRPQFSVRVLARGIVLHHSAGPNAEPRSGQEEVHRFAAVVRSFYDHHTKSNGWKDIGYHFVISRGGLIFEARNGSGKALIDGLIPVGAHCPGKNATHIGICLEGNYQLASELPSSLWESLVRLMARLSLAAGIELNRATVLLHRDVVSTVCPGDTVQNKLDAIITHANRIKDQIRGGA